MVNCANLAFQTERTSSFRRQSALSWSASTNLPSQTFLTASGQNGLHNVPSLRWRRGEVQSGLLRGTYPPALMKSTIAHLKRYFMNLLTTNVSSGLSIRYSRPVTSTCGTFTTEPKPETHRVLVVAPY